jgi:hypothetical protein
MARFVRQYTSRDTSRDERWNADIMVVALGTATVTVGSPSALKNAQAMYRKRPVGSIWLRDARAGKVEG